MSTWYCISVVCLCFSIGVVGTYEQHWFGLMRGEYDDCECVQLDGFCIECRSSYVWTDGTVSSFQVWGNDLEPGNEACAMFGINGWFDEYCENLLDYVCERGDSLTHSYFQTHRVAAPYNTNNSLSVVSSLSSIQK